MDKTWETHGQDMEINVAILANSGQAESFRIQVGGWIIGAIR